MSAADKGYDLSDPRAERNRLARLALPHDHHAPPGVGQGGANILITGDVAGELGVPVVDVATWPAGERAARVLVPEAAVDEHGQARPAEDQVGRPRQVSGVQPEAEPCRMERAPKAEFWPGVALSNCPHYPGAHQGIHGGADLLMDLKAWLVAVCASYRFDPLAIYRHRGQHEWPLVGDDADDLARKLDLGGHFLPLPREPAALANVIEVSLVAFVLERLGELAEATARRGTERGYPDIEISGARFGGGFHAVDVKVARRHRRGQRTQSAITLLTGNTFFRFPDLHWPGTLRAFADYSSHLDIVAVYTFDPESKARAHDLEVIVQEPWRIASKQRSSSTREYIGAVRSIEALRKGRGEFASEAEFLAYWRKFPFKTGRVVEQQLHRLLARKAG